MTALLLAPHHDDETLFAAFTIIRHRPRVVVVLESHLQSQRALGRGTPEARTAEPLTNAHRRQETLEALCVLAGGEPDGWFDQPGTGTEFWPFRDDAPEWDAVDGAIRAALPGCDRVFAPAPHVGGHDHHNAVGQIAERAARDLGVELVHYATYVRGSTEHGVPDQRMRTQVQAEYEPEWVARKLRALACYRSQIALWPHHFLADQREWYA